MWKSDPRSRILSRLRREGEAGVPAAEIVRKAYGIS